MSELPSAKKRLGRYQVIRPLAAGGMGEIYVAEHTGLSGFAKRVALKLISPEFTQTPHYVELFLNEARVGSFLNHPNIVHIFDVGHDVIDDEDTLWLVMEYVDGVDIKRLNRRARLAGQPLPPALLAWVMMEVLSALEEAHAGGPFRKEPIIHRDLSPENVLIARSGAVKVLDFGLAKWAPGRSAVPSMEGNLIFGKVRYMPPEQLKGKLIDVRADLFALGVVLYECLAGKLPFGSGNANEVLRAIRRGPPPSPTELAGEPDAALDAIVARAMAPEADDRYQSATEMRAALADYVRARQLSLPGEQLRGLLHSRGSEPAGGGPLPSGVDEPASTIPLSVAKRCGKCGGGFHALFIDGMIADRCGDCSGIWLDYAEVQRVLGEPHSRPDLEEADETFAERARLDKVIGSCPTCKVALRAFEVPRHPAALEVCPLCFAAWFDAGELQLLHDEGVLLWFKTLLDSLKAVRR